MTQAQDRVLRFADIARKFGERGKRVAYEYFIQHKTIPSDSLMEELMALLPDRK